MEYVLSYSFSAIAHTIAAQLSGFLFFNVNAYVSRYVGFYTALWVF